MAVYLFYNSQQETRSLTSETRRDAPGQFVRLQDGLVHYRLHGNPSDPLIVFIHGGGITGEEVWSRNTSYFLDNQYRVLTYDLFGRGYSDRTATQTTGLLQRQLDNLLDTLQLDSTFHIVALSMGAVVALDYIQRYPERVRKLTLIDPAASGDFKLNPALKVPVMSDFLLATYWCPRAVENQRKEFVNKQLFNDYAQRLRYFMNFEGYKATNYATWTNILNQNRIPAISEIDPDDLLIIYGADDPYFREGQRKLYYSEMEKVQFAEIQNAGHMPNYEQPEKVNMLIDAFLSQP